jgi:multidrug efflux system membrane fusion protein
VTSADIANADFPVYLDGLGTVQPFDTVTVRSRVDGQITNVLFKQGQMVKKGDPLLEIDKRPFQAALDQAVAKKAQDEATLRNAKLDLQRYSTLAKQEFSSRQQLDTQQALVDQVAAQVQGDQSTIDSARTQLDYSTITSPLTGRTGFRLVDPGNIIHATDANGVVTIVRMQPISIVFTAPEGALPAINKALAAGDVPVDALTSDGKTVLSHGRLALVDNSVASASGTISMKATFENSDDALWPGQSVSTRMRVDLLKQVTVVPEDAVQHGPNGLLAYVIGRDDRVAPRPIEVSQIGNGEAVVTKGLSAGEKIVVEGQYRLQPGSKVQASPMAPPVESEKLAQADH